MIETSLHTEQKSERLELSLHLKEQQLNSLLQVTQAINNNLSARGLLKLYENLMVQDLGLKKFAFFIHNINWMCTNAYGIDRHKAEDLIMKDLLSFRQIILLTTASPELAEQFGIVVPVYVEEIPLAFTFLDSVHEEHGTIQDQLNYVQTISSVIAVSIENKKLSRLQKKQKFLKAEMELARQMQIMLIPGNLPDNARISFAGTYLPDQEVGGDYYDYLEINEHEFFFCIADVSGKGVAAALLMASFQASLRSYAEKEYSLLAIIESLNARMNEITSGEKFITLFLAKYNMVTRELEYVNAGHNSAILFRNGETKLLHEGCTLLGMFEKLPSIHVQKIHLPEEFLVFCYTDGLIDFQNDKKEVFDADRLVSFVKQNHLLSPVEFNKALVDYMVLFKGTKMINDDISLLTCKIFGNSGS